jgi:membrane protein
VSRLKSIGSLFAETSLEWWRDNALRLSAAVSYYAVLSLAPLLAIVIRVMGWAHERQYAREQIIEQSIRLMGTQAAEAIKPILESKGENAGYLATVVSTVVLLFSATSVFVELRNSMNDIWGVESKAHKKNRAEHAVFTFIRNRLLSLAMVFGLGFLLVLFIFISGVFSALKQQAAGAHRWPADLVNLAISGAVEFALFGVLFKFLPEVRLKWKDVWHGALIAAVLFGAGRFGLAIYFKYSRIDSVYGAAGSLVAVLMWIYYSSFSLFFGAEFTKVWTRRYDAPA